MKMLLRILLFAILFVFTILLNLGLVDIRYQEIKYLLGNIAAQEDVSNTFGIMAKYELIKRRINTGEDDDSNYELEARIQALTSGDVLSEKQTKNKISKSIYRIPAKLTLNIIRIALGKKIVNTKEEDKIISILEIGYFWERNRKYKEALKIYDDVLSTTSLNPEIKAAVMVHKAFCYSMLSNYSNAKSIYEDVINSFPKTEAGVLSWKLLDFIQGIEKERKALERDRLSIMEKAKQFYILMDYRNAIKNYSKLLGKRLNKKSESEARFYKGRAHEELGETDEAIIEYRRVMRIDRSKIWGRQANRRMLMLGVFYEQQKHIADEAKRQLEQYQDQMFMNDVEKYSNLVSKSSLKAELLDTSLGNNKMSSDKRVVELLDQIGSLDLTGEQEIEKRQTIDKMGKELFQNGQISHFEMRELERKQRLSQNIYRRPGILKRVIDENSGELRYLYNKRLRKGEKLSGKMLVGIKIGADGNVKGVDVIKSDVNNESFESEIASLIKAWKFKAVPDSLGELTVNYPFEFFEEKY